MVSPTPLDSKMSSKPYIVYRQRHLTQFQNLLPNQWVSQWVNQWVNPSPKRNQTTMYSLGMHQSSAQKIPGIIKWNSPIICATQ